MHLTETELDAALALVEEHGLSELLPRMFEVPALRHSWKYARDVLARIDLHQYETRQAVTLFAQKQKYLVRPIHLLDPIDTVLYSAVVRRLAPLIEEKRPRRSSRVVFSYRFTKAGARSFQLTTDWLGFRKRAEALVRGAKYVAVADIADFFAHIYLHRLNNALADLTGRTAEATLLERWLSAWSPDRTSVSQGVPVGPLASNVIAEGLLAEVDQFLLDKGFTFVRYSDDYYIFCQRESDALEALYELSQRLASVERLGLNAAKTRVLPAGRFKDELRSPTRSLQAQRDKFINDFLEGNPYASLDVDELDESELAELDAIGADELLTEALSADIVDLPKVTYALQVLGALKRREAADPVIRNLKLLGPVSRHVGRFLLALETLGPSAVRPLAKRIVKYVESDAFKTPYQVIWLLDPFTRSGSWDNDKALLRLSRSPNELIQRQAVLALSQSSSRSSRQEARTARASPSDWVQRAGLFGWRTLPKDEREHGWPRYRGQWTLGHLLPRAVVEYARSLV